MWVALGLVAGTFISEDATAVGAGILARSGAVPAALAAAAVAAGIWLGDVGLFAAGRLARRWAPLGAWVHRRWPERRLAVLGERLDRGAALAILLSRMVPGSRVPLYVAAGVFPVRAGLFMVWSGLAATAWTAAIVWGLTWL